MQDRYRHLDEKPLATHGRTIHWVKTGKAQCEHMISALPDADFVVVHIADDERKS